MFNINDYFNGQNLHFNEALMKAGRELPEPDDYFQGLALGVPILPENILLFYRRKSMVKQKPALHRRFVLIFNLSGEGSVIIDGKICRLCVGEAILILPHQFHLYADIERDEINWLFITFELSDWGLIKNLGGHSFAISNIGKLFIGLVLETFLKLKSQIQDKIYDLRMLLACVLMDMQQSYNLLDSKNRNQEINKNQILPESALLIQKATNYIHSHPDLSLSVSKVAQQVHLSASHFRKLFREVMGISLGAYIRRARSHQACFLFRSTTLNVSQMAERCGFSSLYAFSRTFAAEIGMSPLEYKKKFGKT